jgi:hypothetical protein
METSLADDAAMAWDDVAHRALVAQRQADMDALARRALEGAGRMAS